MRVLPAVIAIATLAALTAPSLATEKTDGDAWLKAIMHGKPGDVVTMAAAAIPEMPKGKLDMSKWEHWSWPWKWPMDKK